MELEGFFLTSAIKVTLPKIAPFLTESFKIREAGTVR